MCADSWDILLTDEHRHGEIKWSPTFHGSSLSKINTEQNKTVFIKIRL